MTAAADASSSTSLYDRVYVSQPDRFAKVVTEVEGEIPRELTGTVLRNGAGVLTSGDDPLNFLDAHALIAAVTFTEGRAIFRAEHVDTPMRQKELRANKMLERRLFTNMPGFFSNAFKLELGNNGGHDVYAWAGKLFASQDGGHFSLDTKTLATKGEDRWGGEAIAKELMSPMPRVDPKAKRLVGWVQTPGGTKPDKLRFVEFDEKWSVAARSREVTMGGSPAVIHGHTFSERWYVAAELPAKLSVLSALLGTRTIFDALVLQPGQTSTLLLVPRGREDGKVLRVPTPANGGEVIFHCVNAFDLEDGAKLVLDCVGYSGYVHFNRIAPKELRERMGTADKIPDAAPPTLWRHTIDTATGKVIDTKNLGTMPTEAPDIDRRFRGQKTRYAYGVVPDAAGDEPSPGFYGWFHAVARFDSEGAKPDQWSAGAKKLVSPPAFIPRPGSSEEGDGWLSCWVIDGASGTTDVVLLDAKAVSKGPIATLKLGVALPGINHNNYEAGIELSEK